MEDNINEMEITKTEGAALEVRPIETITAEILYLKQRTGEDILEIGKRLIEAKAQLGHGDWETWLAEKVEFTDRTAQRFMKLAREYENPTPVSLLGASKALLLLALEPVERDEFIEQKHEVDGVEKTVSEMSKRELEAAIKAKKKAEEESKSLKAQLEEKASEYDALVRRAQNEVNSLNEEIVKLQKQKTEVVEVVDTKAVEDLKAQLEKKKGELQKKNDQLTALKKEKDALSEDAATMAERHQAEVKEALRERDAAQLRANTLEKKLATSGDESLAEFKVYFEQVKTGVNKMFEAYQKALAMDPAKAANMQRAASGILQQSLNLFAPKEGNE